MFRALVPTYLAPSEFWECDYEDLTSMLKTVAEEYKSRLRLAIVQNRIFVRDLTRAITGKPFDAIESMLPILQEERKEKRDWKKDKEALFRWVERMNNG